MRTPLTVMSGYAQFSGWQISEGSANSETVKNLNVVSQEAMRLADMITKLMTLTFDRELLPNCSKLDPKDVLDNAASLCRPILQKNGNRLELSCKTSASVFSNADVLLQVLVNLAVNANRHTTNGVIRFSVVSTDDFATFLVEDTGDGIPYDVLPHLFEKGVSGDGNSGLGLSICRDIIRQCGGEIHLERTGKNGTAFAFTIPVYKENDHGDNSVG